MFQQEMNRIIGRREKSLFPPRTLSEKLTPGQIGTTFLTKKDIYVITDIDYNQFLHTADRVHFKGLTSEEIFIVNAEVFKTMEEKNQIVEYLYAIDNEVNKIIKDYNSITK